MAELALHMLAQQFDTKRREIALALQDPTITDQDSVRLQGMRAGLVWARIALQAIADETDRAAAGGPVMRPDTSTCVGCSAVGSADNPLLTALPEQPRLMFYVCRRCWHTTAARLREGD